MVLRVWSNSIGITGNFWDMRSLRPHPNSGMKPRTQCILTGHPGDSDARASLRATPLGEFVPIASSNIVLFSPPNRSQHGQIKIRWNAPSKNSAIVACVHLLRLTWSLPAPGCESGWCTKKNEPWEWWPKRFLITRILVSICSMNDSPFLCLQGISFLVKE